LEENGQIPKKVRPTRFQPVDIMKFGWVMYLTDKEMEKYGWNAD